MEKTEPTMRVRVSHAHTLKDGWRCDSTTVELDGPLPIDWDDIGVALRRAAIIGRDEADQRNKEATS